MTSWLNTIKIIAHRGSSVEHTENTKTAILAAFREGAEMIEVDIRATGDHHLIVFHDQSLRRLAKKSWLISRSPWNEIKDITLRRNEHILSLEELLTLAKGKFYLNLEIKVRGYEQPILELLHSNGMAKQVLISSKHLSVIKHFRELDARIPLALVVNYANIRVKSDINQATAYGIEGVHPINFRTSKSLISYAHNLGLSVRPYSINAARRMCYLFSIGADGIMTDKPTLLAQVVHDLK